jgi:hypothetical protein
LYTCFCVVCFTNEFISQMLEMNSRIRYELFCVFL